MLFNTQEKIFWSNIFMTSSRGADCNQLYIRSGALISGYLPTLLSTLNLFLMTCSFWLQVLNWYKYLKGHPFGVV